MEGLGLVETVAVRCAVHVRVQVLFSLPGSSVPTLTVTFIATRHRVRSSAHFQLGSRLEDLRVVTASPVGSIVDLWADEACTGRRGGVVLGLGVLAGVEHGATTVASASHLHSLVVLGDHRGIETSRGESIGGLVNDVCLEDVARLLSDALAEVLVVDADAWHVPSVAWNDGGLARHGALGRHVMSGGTVEVLVRPLAETFFTKLGRSPVVFEGELCVRL